MNEKLPPSAGINLHRALNIASMSARAEREAIVGYLQRLSQTAEWESLEPYLAILARNIEAGRHRQ